MAIGKITSKSLAADAVTSANLAPGAVTIADIADGEITAGKLHTTLDLSTKTLTLTQSSVTAHQAALSVTQSQISDLSTTSDLTEGTNLYYTDARADARAALLVDSAPATLDTLNELAAALGDDPNFATTTANNIATKLPLAGGAMTGPITTNSTFDGVDIAARDAVLTSTTTTANAALPKSGGTMTGTLDATTSASDSYFFRGSHATTTNFYITNTNATTGNVANLLLCPANNVAGAYLSSIATEDFSTSANRTADLAFYTRKDGTFGERLRIDSSGNVGIGTSSSLTNLSIAGTESGLLSRVNIDVANNQNRTLTISEQKLTFSAPDTYGSSYDAYINYNLTDLKIGAGV